MDEKYKKDLIDRLYDTVKDYKNPAQYESVFMKISESYHHENYHSDILAYYLKYDEVKMFFINWLNELFTKKNIEREINCYTYFNGEIKREEFDDETKKRMDIVLYASTEKNVIIIENKSNNAPDQPRQLYDYYKSLNDEEFTVDAIFYLNKNVLKLPKLDDLDDNEKNKIERLIIPATLGNDNSFIENVIDKVISNTKQILDASISEDIDKIRLLALSYEIKSLFKSISAEGENMENLETFVKELSENNNLEKVKEIIEAYNSIPNEYLFPKINKFLNDKYKDFIRDRPKNFEEPGIFIWQLNQRTGIKKIIFDIITENGINFAVDICFDDVNAVTFELWIRSGKKKINIETLKKVKRFPFNANIKLDGPHHGYQEKINDVLIDIEKLTDMFDRLIEFAIELIKL